MRKGLDELGLEVRQISLLAEAGVHMDDVEALAEDEGVTPAAFLSLPVGEMVDAVHLDYLFELPTEIILWHIDNKIRMKGIVATDDGKRKGLSPMLEDEADALLDALKGRLDEHLWACLGPLGPAFLAYPKGAFGLAHRQFIFENFSEYSCLQAQEQNGEPLTVNLAERPQF